MHSSSSTSAAAASSMRSYKRIWLHFLWAIHTAVTAVHFVCTAVINQPLTNLAVVANCPRRIKTSSFTFLWLILIFLLVVRFSWPLYPSNVPPHFELKSNEMADLKKKTTTNESLNSHWLPANVAGRLTVLPANCKIHPHLARGRVLISGPAVGQWTSKKTG